MRIAIIAVVGILSYLLVLLPGYFLLVSEDEEESAVTETLVELPTSSATAKTTKKLPLTNPGEAPPPKWKVTYYYSVFLCFTQNAVVYTASH